MNPNDQELKALELFVNPDETRAYLNTVWMYFSDGGCTHVASDGHTIAVRRAGAHVQMSLLEIERMTPTPLDHANQSTPPHWSSLCHAPNCEGKNLAIRGINPAYFARVATVERAAGRRAAADYKPEPGMSKKYEKQKRANLADGACSVWSIGVTALDGWYWKIPGDSIVWEGVIMPRRV